RKECLFSFKNEGFFEI
ncbi:Hypothetical protein EIN_201050, partial [Entamoeba invadens IP1]